jgi:alkylated DNA repair protein alkB family protein 7
MSRIALRCLSSLISGSAPRDFHLIPDFLSVAEQRILLTAALQKLDAFESRRLRLLKKDRPPTVESPHLQDIFYPDDHYRFDEARFIGISMQ